MATLLDTLASAAASVTLFVETKGTSTFYGILYLASDIIILLIRYLNCHLEITSNLNTKYLL